MNLKKQMELLDKMIRNYLKAPDAMCPQVLNLLKSQKYLHETVILAPYVKTSLEYEEGGVVWDKTGEMD